jgi:hypothetical protein
MHCGTPGPGSIAPTNPMQQVIDWVDRDAIYSGGDPNAAAMRSRR